MFQSEKKPGLGTNEEQQVYSPALSPVKKGKVTTLVTPKHLENPTVEEL